MLTNCKDDIYLDSGGFIVSPTWLNESGTVVSNHPLWLPRMYNVSQHPTGGCGILASVSPIIRPETF